MQGEEERTAAGLGEQMCLNSQKAVTKGKRKTEEMWIKMMNMEMVLNTHVHLSFHLTQISFLYSNKGNFFFLYI